jgi:hypothetical protein
LSERSGNLADDPFRRIALLLALLSAAMLAAGCSSGGERTVFAVARGFGQGLQGVRPVDIVDLGLPQLYNTTDQRIRLRAVTLVSAPRAVHVRSITAYVFPSDDALGIGRGDLLRYCRKINRPYPVTAAVASPHAYANWEIVIAFTIARPGVYRVERAKISYTVGGHSGWQYQNLNTTIRGVPASPGAKPHLDGCL